MKNFTLLSFLLFIAFSGFSIDIPPGGTNMIADAISNYTKVGSQGTVTVINADHPEFDKALKVDVTSLPENYWNFQVAFKTTMALEKGDICLVSFWARCTKSNSEAGDGLITPIIEHNETYEKPLSHSFAVGGEWTHFVYGFESNMSLPLANHRAAIFFGHAVQTIEIANIQYLNYKNSISLDELPEMEIMWAGMEPDAPWRTEAAARIEKFRKGNVTVKLVDADNHAVSDAAVSFEMKNHKFGFGSAIDGKTYLSNPTYRNHIHELFSEVVFENDLKWKPWVTRSNNTYILTAIDSLHHQGINVRGHNLIWPGWQYLPSFMELYKTNPPRLEQECIDHIEEVAGYTKGKLIDWDVINEPYTNHDIQDITGDEVMADWFKKTKEVDTDVKRYINDYSILGNGGVDVNHQNGYFNIIQYIDENGGEIQGIGLQGHFAELVTGIPKVFEILDRFASLNKELKVTEFDINSTKEEFKANYTRDFMTALFSHPYVKGFLAWGFWAGRHWRPEAAYYDLNWDIRPQGEMYKKLVLDEWWTKKQTITSDMSGMSGFGSCFLGTYELEVEYNGKTIVKTVPVDFNSENMITLNVADETVILEGENHAETPVFTSSKRISAIKKGELKIYPNPASTKLHIELSGSGDETYSVQVINIAGSCVLNQKMNFLSDNVLQLPQLEPGIYFLSVLGKKQRITERFVVQ